MLIFLILGAAGGATSALYLVYNYHPLLLNGVVHGGIFISPFVGPHVFCQEIECAYSGLYLAGALYLCILQYIV
jgi:hypothetical protein